VVASTLLRFAFVGLANTFTGLLFIYAAKFFGDFGDVSANALGYSVGICLSFALNRSWTFKHRGSTVWTFVGFVLVQLIAYLANLATVLAALALGINGYVAQALAIVPYASISYLLSKHLVFPPKPRRCQVPD
jgi:putative flippase GtrA